MAFKAAQAEIHSANRGKAKLSAGVAAKEYKAECISWMHKLIASTLVILFLLIVILGATGIICLIGYFL